MSFSANFSFHIEITWNSVLIGAFRSSLLKKITIKFGLPQVCFNLHFFPEDKMSDKLIMTGHGNGTTKGTEDEGRFSEEEKLKIFRACLSIQSFVEQNKHNEEELNRLPAGVTGSARRGVPSNIQKIQKQGKP